jgi:hypothetical protein
MFVSRNEPLARSHVGDVLRCEEHEQDTLNSYPDSESDSPVSWAPGNSEDHRTLRQAAERAISERTSGSDGASTTILRGRSRNALPAELVPLYEGGEAALAKSKEPGLVVQSLDPLRKASHLSGTRLTKLRAVHPRYGLRNAQCSRCSSPTRRSPRCHGRSRVHGRRGARQRVDGHGAGGVEVRNFHTGRLTRTR